MLRARAFLRLETAEARVAALEAKLRKANQGIIHDPLTGALNRTGLHEVFDHEAARARQTDQPLALVMIDLDNFKAINDQYGPAAGDGTLVHLSLVVSQSLRQTDYCCRWGGGKFVVLLPGADYAGSKRVLARLQVEVIAKPVAPTSLSFIVCVVPFLGESLEQMLARGDRVIMRIKNRRRVGKSCQQLKCLKTDGNNSTAN
jgi:diguanylate cyclase